MKVKIGDAVKINYPNDKNLHNQIGTIDRTHHGRTDSFDVEFPTFIKGTWSRGVKRNSIPFHVDHLILITLITETGIITKITSGVYILTTKNKIIYCSGIDTKDKKTGDIISIKGYYKKNIFYSVNNTED